MPDSLSGKPAPATCGMLGPAGGVVVLGSGGPQLPDHHRITIRSSRCRFAARLNSGLSQALNVIEHHLGSTLLAMHLYGSALDGGLKPYSDIDLLVTVTARLDESVRQALFVDLLGVSVFPGQSRVLRALEVTIVVHSDIVPWRYPARRELQFGEWQRKDILAGIFEPATTDVDLAILLTKARQHSLALAGSAAEDFFNPVPESDLFKALADTLKLWNSQPDWIAQQPARSRRRMLPPTG
ncbi:hypothetical protein G6F24_009692 [Rhizopus arrhizus]|nr:hypothetical protein G6F24_009692 [Rhizopus arrhizus]